MQIDSQLYTQLYTANWRAQYLTLCRDWQSMPQEELRDLLQDAWLRAWSTWDADKATGEFIAWVWLMIKQELHKRVSRYKEQARLAMLPIVDRAEALDDSDTQAVHDVATVDGAANIEITDLVSRIFHVARDRDRTRHRQSLPWEPIITCLIRGLRYAEIAKELSMASDRSVCVLILQMRKKLKEELAL